MNDFIRIRPAARRRVPFARWAVSQNPKIRTVSQSEFGVPPVLFVDMPEDLLRGSLVDGRPYVSPLDQEEETEAAGPGAPELLGVATRGPDGFLEAVPGQPLPEVPAHIYGPDAVPLPADFAPLEDAPETYELSGVLVGETGPETYVPLGDTSGDTPGGALAQGGDTAGETPAVTSEDTPGDTGDTAGDTSGGTGRSFPCGACPRAFKSERGRDSHRRQVHGR
ncbi:hypothetical protein [Streptomyces sp. CCM_MD2014]|uniref:hypothetical protein n=1 Tax=Streptomyces sp. CCM_MD2014 TaxID=1561022 RepID=UPI00052A9BD7|nr:hypothetical protein [Streptomyces sp. CCM_MD2014]AIV35613.1 hypothetical protein NI25_20670 [Streptomyces sp. CCM_MD2014]